ncbi:MAG: hypothetical protein FWF99_01635 [Desulfovibrionaceae bacterium]|nr:hypothetical protein [Desulfovibrionaceae bacterium]
MGCIDPYFPKEVALKLRDAININTFIETGTFFGATSKWAASEFQEVHTIELSEHIYNITKDDLSSWINIRRHLGNSKNILPEILKKIESNVLFWLDGHYSKGITAGADEPCPLLFELQSILPRQYNDIILIDDAHFYTGKDGFPTIFDITSLTNKISPMKRNITVCDDHIYIIPDNEIIIDIVYSYIIKRQIILYNKTNTITNTANNLLLLIKNAICNLPRRVKNISYDLFIKCLKKTKIYNPARYMYRIYKK